MRKANNLFFFLFLIFISESLFATHQRAAEITYRHISGFTYEITLVTYTFSLSPADRPQLTVYWGDGSSSILQRSQKTPVPGSVNIDRNLYIGQHTYAAPATYIITMEDPNRNQGVINIPNSVNIPIFVSTTLVINPFVGSNSSPVLSNAPIDRGCVGRPFYHNPGAIDVEGDSLSYKLIPCRGEAGLNIVGYTFPFASNSFSIDEITGTLTWDSPAIQGEYNIAIQINEYRNGMLLSSITRDMQILIIPCINEPPKIITINDTCITAGETLIFDVTATDPNPTDNLRLTATGGPFNVTSNPAVFPAVNGNSPITSQFTWETNCSHVRLSPYTVFFRAEDRNSEVNLTYIKVTNIRIVSPGPKNLTAQAVANSVVLNWESTICKNSAGYRVYRRIGPSGFIPQNCETGVPAYTQYVFIGSTTNVLDTTFIDNNNGTGLIHGPEYCYMVVAYFNDGSQSYASNEACATLIKDIPVITNVSVRNTDTINGSIFVAWSKPDSIDTQAFPGPYSYRVFRGSGFNPSNFSMLSILNSINDTVYIDTLINTRDFPHSYYIEFWDNSSVEPIFIGSTFTTSSIFLEIESYDKTLFLNWSETTPWTNYEYIVYRYNNSTLQFDSVGVTTERKFTDTGLLNNFEYCYMIKSKGSYFSSGFNDPLINFSQISCQTPIDFVAPCPPRLTVMSDCKSISNKLQWTNPMLECDFSSDTYKYKIYYAPTLNSAFQLIHTENNAYNTEFVHFLNNTVAGCYKITSIDSTGNESTSLAAVCVDINKCDLYRLPNVFSPNDDGYNDFWQAFPFDFVNKINLTVFNRWGTVVYKTSDPYFRWNGLHYINNSEVAEGVYFYVCEVEELTLNGLVTRTISGSLSIFRNINKTKY